MTFRRLLAAAVTMLALAGCHEDPTVVPVTVGPASDALTIPARGGDATSSTATQGTGGNGGTIRAGSSGTMNLGGGGTGAVIPSAPPVPATGNELDNAEAIAGVALDGNI